MNVVARIGWCAGLTALVAGTVWAILRADPVAALFGAAAVIGYLVGPIPFPFHRARKPVLLGDDATPTTKKPDPWAVWL